MESAAAHCVSYNQGLSGSCGESLNVEIIDIYFGLSCIMSTVDTLYKDVGKNKRKDVKLTRCYSIACY